MSLTKRQSEIIDAALKLTAEGGIQNLTIKNLGNALGITEPAIYRHFRSKSEIVRTMIGRFDEAVPAESAEGRPAAGPGDVRRRAVHGRRGIFRTDARDDAPP